MVGLPMEATPEELGKSVFWMGGRSAGHDGPLDDKTIYRIIKKLMKDAADEVAESQPEIASQLLRAGAGPHTIRHTMATMFIEGGGDIRIAQTQLGHSSSAMTTKVYDNKARTAQADAIQAFWVNKALNDRPVD
jgi:integrase